MAAHPNRVAVITGAGSGIGRALTQNLLESGTAVVAVDLTEEKLDWTEASTARGELAAHVADVSTEAGNHSMVAVAEARFGGLDEVALNAGIDMSAGIEEQTIEDF